jgi:hypothetical protein
LALGFAALPAGVAALSCSTDAVGVDACRKIEEARCQLAPMCTANFDSARCTRFYRDECLVGIQNTTNTDNNALSTSAQNCVNALNAVAMCAGGGDGGCLALDVLPNASCTAASMPPTPCNVILFCPEVLGECSFVEAPVDAGAADAAADAAAE